MFGQHLRIRHFLSLEENVPKPRTQDVIPLWKMQRIDSLEGEACSVPQLLSLMGFQGPRLSTQPMTLPNASLQLGRSYPCGDLIEASTVFTPLHLHWLIFLETRGHQQYGSQNNTISNRVQCLHSLATGTCSSSSSGGAFQDESLISNTVPTHPALPSFPSQNR